MENKDFEQGIDSENVVEKGNELSGKEVEEVEIKDRNSIERDEDVSSQKFYMYFIPRLNGKFAKPTKIVVFTVPSNKPVQNLINSANVLLKKAVVDMSRTRASEEGSIIVENYKVFLGACPIWITVKEDKEYMGYLLIKDGRDDHPPLFAIIYLREDNLWE